MNRPIDAALGKLRPQKLTIRQLWLDEVRHYIGDTDVPLYLTLPGAEGIDIQLLIEDGIVQLEPNGAIRREDQGKVVAVESNMEAVLSLQKRFPGLRIRDTSIENELQGTSVYAWPSQEVRKDFCARVINIDSDKPLAAKLHQEEAVFPLIGVVRKISQLHANPQNGGARGWTLCVTINCSIEWPEAAVKFFWHFLSTNCNEHAEFHQELRTAVGDGLADSIAANPADVTFNDISTEDRQRLLAVFLPKLILSNINDHQWAVQNAKCLIYGEGPEEAPMASICMRFERASGANLHTGRRYAHNLIASIQGLGKIEADGVIA